MNREQAKELAPIIKAFGDGVDVQREGQLVKCWCDDADPTFSATHRWRIKPKPIETWVLFDCTGHPRLTSNDRSLCVAEAVRLERVGLLHPYRIVHMTGVME